MFKIDRLCIYSVDEQCYEYKFESGVNYFQGGNNTGKTVFYKFMDYMFGASNDISNDSWFRGTFFKAEMFFQKDGIEYIAVRSITKEKNFFGYAKDNFLEPVNHDVYRERLASVFSPGEEMLKEMRNFVEEDVTYRTFTLFNFLGETRQGVLNNFFDKCDKINYSTKIGPILNYIFNNNLAKISRLKNEIQVLLSEIAQLEEGKHRYEFVCKKINMKLSQLGVKIKYNGYNSVEIRKELIKIKEMEEMQKEKVTNIAVLETVYNNLKEQIKLYENTIQDAKQFERQSKNQKELFERLNIILQDNDNYRYLIEPLIEMSEELDQSISFSKYVQKDETINILKNQLSQVKSKIQEQDSRFRCFEVNEKAKMINVVEDLLDIRITDDEEVLIEKKNRLREIKKELRFLQNSNDESKLAGLSRRITKLYSSAEACSEVVAKDLGKQGFEIKYFKNGNLLQPIVTDKDKAVNYYTGSMARHTLMQLAGYIGFLSLLLEEQKYPVIPVLVLDHISKPFDSDNGKAIGIILEKTFELIDKSNFQVFIFDDLEDEELGINADHFERLANGEKTGFNPFYKG